MSDQQIIPVRPRPDTGLGQMPLSDPRARGFELWARQLGATARPKRRTTVKDPIGARAVRSPRFEDRLDTYI